MKVKRKIISLLLVIGLMTGLLPQAAFAAETDTGKAIQLVDGGTAANISGGQADNIYFGNYQQRNLGSAEPTDGTENIDWIKSATATKKDLGPYYSKDPVKWRVLENADGQLFLLSDQNLDVFQYHTDYESVTWEKSAMRSWLNGYGAEQNTGGDSGTDYTSNNFIGAAFSEKAQEAIADTEVVNDDHPDYGTEGGNSTTDKIFLLSITEAESGSCFADDASRISTNTAYVTGGGEIGTNGTNGVGEADYWWLRSPGRYDNRASSVNIKGDVYYSYGYHVDNDDNVVRPAFNLDLNAVLFTSAAVGGKSAGGMENGLTAVDNYDGNEWKLTLLDKDRQFAVTEETAGGKPGDTITLNYTGATTGTNEYISAIIADRSGAQYYGRVAQPNATEGQIEIKIPTSLATGTYTLRVFSEQYNGDYKTDYASAFETVALTVEDTPAPSLAENKTIQLVDGGTAANISGGQADNIYFGTYQQSSDGNNGYNTDPVKWRVLENANGQLFILSDQNLDVFEYHKENESVTWETSTMRSWLNGYDASKNIGGDNGIDYTSDNFLDSAFSVDEQGALANTTVSNSDNPNYGTEGGNATTDKIFLLSWTEANNGRYFADDSSRIATNTAYVAGGGKINSNEMFDVGEADWWWLRSPGRYDGWAARVKDDGDVCSEGLWVDNYTYTVRPAFNLDLNAVLFTSAAVGGKSAGGMENGLTAVENYDGNEWKLTLLDESRKFEIENEEISETTVTFDYKEAQTGANEYISAVVIDNGTIAHYGRILQLDGTTKGESGTASLTLPDGVTLSDTTKLYVFNEQYNGDKLTDYASQPIEVNNPTVDTTAPTLTAGSVSRDSDTAATVKFTADEAGSYYYSVVDSGAAEPDIDSNGAGTACTIGENTISLSNLTAGAKDIYIVVKDAVGNVSDKLKITIPTKGYTLTVNLNGGSGTTTGGEYAEGAVIDIDAGSRNDYRFSGWTTADGSTVGFADATKAKTAFTMPKGDVTIEAHWTAESSGPSGSVIEIDKANNGKVTVTPRRADKGDTVTVTVTPDEGYILDILTVTDNKGKTLDVAKQADGTYTFTMPRGKVSVSVTFVKEEVPEVMPFVDVPMDAWYHDAVYDAYTKGLMVGTDATHFSPLMTTSRGMIVTMLYRLAGSPSLEDEILGYPYEDVNANAYYANAVYWARMNDIVSGYSADKFGPNDPITREQLAGMLMRFAAWQGDDVSARADLSAYSDADKVSGWASDAVQWAVAKGYLAGTGDNILSPQGQATRAQTAAVFTRVVSE